MKTVIYTFFLLIFPLTGWAQFEDFIKIEKSTVDGEAIVMHEEFPCNLEYKVVVQRTAAKDNKLIITFSDYNGKSIETQSLLIGKGAYTKSFGLEDNLVILIGTQGGVYEGSVLTGVVVVSYEDMKVIEMGEYDIKGKYKLTKAGTFMVTRSAASFKEMDKTIAFEDRGKLTLFDLVSKKIVPIDLKLKSTHVVYEIIPSTSEGEAHVLTGRNGNMNNMEILRIGSNGTILSKLAVDERFSKGIFRSSISFCEESGTYYAAGLTASTLGYRVTGMRCFSYKEGKTEIKNFGFTSKESLELSGAIENSENSKMNFGGECHVYRADGKTFVFNKFYEVITDNNQRVSKTWRKINCIQLDSKNNIVTQTSFPFDGVSGIIVQNFSASYNPESSTINYISSDPYSYDGIALFSYNMEENESTSEMLFDGFVMRPTIIDSSHAFIYGIFKDGEPYTLQQISELSEASWYTGILEF